jgi:predicted component of type VI protein secretion system
LEACSSVSLHSWHKDGIWLLPLGTGITVVDWMDDLTTGSNRPLTGGDTMLITRKDFRVLVGSLRSLSEI